MIQLYPEVQKAFLIIDFIVLFHSVRQPTFCTNQNGDHILRKCRRFRLIKKSYQQFSLNNLMKTESLFELYFDVVFFFFFAFFAIFA